ncbi:hypothetical protein C824_003807 [Schaedlerella arabinosiphila]|nr:hypothetical protein C824_003807 [Schaedlerella arabinosiphila]
MTPQEELAALRHLIEKQQKEIAEKDAVIENRMTRSRNRGLSLKSSASRLKI